jgi:hypothetical protein
MSVATENHNAADSLAGVFTFLLFVSILASLLQDSQ